MRAVRSYAAHEPTGRLSVFLGFDNHATRHAEMRQQDGIVVECADQIFRSAPKSDKRAAAQAVREILRHRKTKIPPPNLDLLNASAFHRLRQAASNGFHFR